MYDELQQFSVRLDFTLLLVIVYVRATALAGLLLT